VNKNFFYEHIGHMQFSTLTLQSLIAIEDITEGTVGKFVPWDKVRQSIVDCGFSLKQADGELDRFCYGFECQEKHDDGQRGLVLTAVGRMFIDTLTAEAPRQDSQLAALLRPARRKDHWNIIVQESTFWPKAMYDLVQKFKLRKGPARDFLKCLSRVDVIDFLSAQSKALTNKPKEDKKATLSDCLQMVKTHGKYWATVGGKYSWFVFSQRFEMPTKNQDWEKYEQLVKILIRPPEWGGGKTILPTTLTELLGTERQERFLQFGIVRPIYTPEGQLRHYQMTALGYLMWERRCKGPIYELVLRRLANDHYSLSLCSASDLPNPGKPFSKQNSFPSWEFTGAKDDILDSVKNLLAQNKNQSELAI